MYTLGTVIAEKTCVRGRLFCLRHLHALALWTLRVCLLYTFRLLFGRNVRAWFIRDNLKLLEIMIHEVDGLLHSLQEEEGQLATEEVSRKPRRNNPSFTQQ